MNLKKIKVLSLSFLESLKLLLRLILLILLYFKEPFCFLRYESLYVYLLLYKQIINVICKRSSILSHGISR